jgi:hypothetical protein
VSAESAVPIALQVFARVPLPGRVKTRLAAGIGAEQAAIAYAALAEGMLARAATWVAAEVAAGAAAALELWIDGDAAHPWVHGMAMRHAAAVYVQPAGDIGTRMHEAIAAALRRGCWPLLAGTDCPGIDGDYLSAAAAALRGGTRLVLGPVDDGGYALIGLRDDVPALFAAMPWSTPAVTAETVRRARAAGIEPLLLPSCYDIDTAADLARHGRDVGTARN